MLKTIRTIPCGVDDVYVPQRHRKLVDQKEYEALRDDIALNGLMTPITVRIVDVPDWDGEGPVEDGIVLVAGFNRLKAMKELGKPEIMCTFVEGTDDEIRLWEIAENLKRCGLKGIEFGEHVAAYDEIIGRIRKPVPQGQVSGGRGNKGGHSQTARELGISHQAVARAKDIADLTEEAKDYARSVGLDKATNVLADARKHGGDTAAGQIAYLQDELLRRREREAERRAARETPVQPKAAKLADDPLNDLEALERQVARLMSAWNAASPQAREEFLLRVDRPTFDTTRAGRAA